MILIAVCLALIAVGVWAIWQGQQKQRPPYINISRAQYEDALAKWQGQHIEEYEITTDSQSMLGGILALRVTDSGKKTEVLHSNLTSPELDALGSRYISDNTIEGIFAQIDKILRDEGTSIATTASSSDFYMANSIDFDPVLGYPKRLGVQAVPASDGTSVADVAWSVSVTSFAIIKRGK